jgi:hypothetical protein
VNVAKLGTTAENFFFGNRYGDMERDRLGKIELGKVS